MTTLKWSKSLDDDFIDLKSHSINNERQLNINAVDRMTITSKITYIQLEMWTCLSIILQTFLRKPYSFLSMAFMHTP